jgi:hypothetical protein
VCVQNKAEGVCIQHRCDWIENDFGVVENSVMENLPHSFQFDVNTKDCRPATRPLLQRRWLENSKVKCDFWLGAGLTGLPARGVLDVDGLKLGKLREHDLEFVNEVQLANVGHTTRKHTNIDVNLRKRYTHRYTSKMSAPWQAEDWLGRSLADAQPS